MLHSGWLTLEVHGLLALDDADEVAWNDSALKPPKEQHKCRMQQVNNTEP